MARTKASGMASAMRLMARQPVQCIVSKFSKPIIDEIDRVLANYYGLTDEELDFIINYDIKYRMGQHSEEGREEDL